MDKKIKVAVLGATGSVGQKFIELLNNHPWFEVAEVAASERSAGKTYREATNWFMSTPMPESVANLIVKECKVPLESKILFSGLDANVAGEIETEFAKNGFVVISNARNHRFDNDVPLLVPEVNHQHLDIVSKQNYNGGIIVTNPNCSTVGLVMALKPIHDLFGITEVNVVTMQALSGAGYPGVPSLDIIDNLIPFIGGEEHKMETEPLKILGGLSEDGFVSASMAISAQCNRVAVLDGHTESVQIRTAKKASAEEIIEAWKSFSALPQELQLPYAPVHPLYYFENERYPQPRLHRNLEKGMAVSIGRLRPCSLFDWKFTVLSHNTVRGAAGGAILNAELMVKKGLIN